MNEAGKKVFAKTIWAEARGEPEKGKREVARVIRERAAQGNTAIENVCRQPYQFECWNGRDDIDVSSNEQAYRNIRAWSDKLYDEPLRRDPTAPDHYNNPDKEGYPNWTQNCDRMYKIGEHQFYRAR